MNDRLPWNVKGVEPDLRHDAARAALASGQTLGQWLNGVIRDTLVDIQAARTQPFSMSQGHSAGPEYPPSQRETASPSMSPYQQPYAYPQQGHPQAPYAPQAQGYAPPQQPGHPPQQAYAPPPQPYAPPQQHGYAPPPPPYAPHPYAGPPLAQPYAPPPPPPPPYDPYAWLPSYPPRGYEAETARREMNARGAQRAQEDRLASAIDALSGIVERSEREAARKIAPNPPPPAQQPAVADQLATLMQRLSALEENIARRQEARHETRDDQRREPSPTRTGSGTSRDNSPIEDALDEARKVERQLGDALGHFGSDAPRASGPAVRPPPGRASVRPRVNVVRGGAAAAVAEIAARQRSLDADPAPRALHAAESDALEQIRRSIAAVADQVREARLAAPQSNEVDLQAEIRELQRTVHDLAPRRIVASVNESIRALADKIEQSRQGGALDSQLAPIQRLLADVRASIDKPRDSSGLENVTQALAHLARRVEELGARDTVQPADSELARQIAEIRDLVARARDESPTARIDQQLDRLTRKLDAVVQSPGDSRALAMVGAAVDQIREDLARLDPDRLVALIEDRTAGLDGLGERIEALAARIEQVGARPAAMPDLEPLSRQIERMTQSIVKREQAVDVSHLADRIEEMRATLANRPVSIDTSAIEKRIGEVQNLLERKIPTQPDVRGLEMILRKMAERLESPRAPASNDKAIDALRAQIMLLAERVDNVRAPAGSQKALEDLQSQIMGLASRMEQVRNAPGAEGSLDALRSQIMALAERLDQAGGASAGMAGLERTLGELYHVVNDVRESAVHAARTAAEAANNAAEVAKTAVREALADAGPAGGCMDPIAAEGLVLIKRDLTEMRNAQLAADASSRETLQSVHSALERIVSRLSGLETSRHEPRAPEQPAQPAPIEVAHETRPAPKLARAPDPAPPLRQERPQPQATRPAAMAQPIVAEPGMDLPLEPRGAASPTANPSDPRASFIAAARRAAQTAATQTSAALEDIEKKATSKEALAAASGKLDGLKAKIAERRLPILIGIAAIFVVIGTIHVVSSLFGSSAPEPEPPKVSSAQSRIERRETAARDAASAPLPSRDAARSVETTGSAGASPAAEAQPDRTVVGSIPERAAPPVQPEARIAPQLLPVTPPPEQPVDVASLLKQTPFVGPERLKQAAQNGSLPAIYEVGARYADGRGVQRDLKTAARWLEHAASQGFAPAQYRFGSFNREGLGVEQNAKSAFVWFMRAAEQGHVLAMHNLAVLYAEGVTGSPDYAAAAAWFRNAAEHGVRDSQFNIAILYVRGLGVTQDMVEAYKWFAVAAVQGDADSIKRRDEIAARLTPEQLSDGKQRAESFRAKRPDMRANDVQSPEGGWEQSARPAPAAQKKTRA